MALLEPELDDVEPDDVEPDDVEPDEPDPDLSLPEPFDDLSELLDDDSELDEPDPLELLADESLSLSCPPGRCSSRSCCRSGRTRSP